MCEDMWQPSDVSSPSGNRTRDDSSSNHSFRPRQEALALARIAIPIVVVQLCSLLLWTETASAVGHGAGTTRGAGGGGDTTTENLAGFALASLSANLACQSIFIGILSASDTLSPQAYGAGNYREVGLLAIRAYASAFVLVLPLALLLWYSEVVLLLLGQDPRAAELASLWVRVYMIALPFNLMLNVIQRFLTSQEVVMPLVYCGVATATVVHPLNLYAWSEYVDGYIGSAAALAQSQITMVVLLLAYLKWNAPHKIETWPGLKACREALDKTAVIAFVKLGVGGVLALTEWWFWEFLCFMAGKFGIVPLGVHTIAYQLIPLLFMLPFGISIGLSVRLGSILARDVPRAKKLVAGCLVCCTVLAAATACIVYFSCRAIVAIFTSDEEVVQGCLEIWSDVSKFIFLDALFATNSGVLRALGLQWRLGFVVTIGLWLISVPAIYFVSVTKGGGLHSLWRALPPIYTFLNIALFACYYFADWDDISWTIRKRVSLDKDPDVLKPSHSVVSYGTVSEDEIQLLAMRHNCASEDKMNLT